MQCGKFFVPSQGFLWLVGQHFLGKAHHQERLGFMGIGFQDWFQQGGDLGQIFFGQIVLGQFQWRLSLIKFFLAFLKIERCDDTMRGDGSRFEVGSLHEA